MIPSNLTTEEVLQLSNMNALVEAYRANERLEDAKIELAATREVLKAATPVLNALMSNFMAPQQHHPPLPLAGAENQRSCRTVLRIGPIES